LLAADAVGGVWQYSVELAHGLARLGIESLLTVCGPSPSASQRALVKHMDGVRLIDTGLALDWLADESDLVGETGAALAALARREAVDLVQLNGAASAADAVFDVPVVVVQHSCVASWWEAVRGGALPPDFGWRTALVAEGLNAADIVVTPTAAFGDTIRRIYGLRRAPTTVHNGRSPMALRESAMHDCVFTAGRLWDEGKNLATLDAAAARLAVPFHAAGPIRGPGGQQVALDAIHSVGEVDDEGMSRWLRARPIFASAALYEPFGLAVLEAALAGCPLVLSDIPTFRELWDGAAIFVPARDAAGFAEAIEELIGDDFRRAQLGRAACDRAARYRPETMAARMAEIYAGLIGKGAEPARTRYSRIGGVAPS
jgi:glycosyltransferase involved in cell wall biosynthesis